MLKKYGLYLLFTVVIFAGQFLRSSHLVTGIPPAIAQSTLQNQAALASINQGPAVIYFWAEWCGVCRLMQSAISAINPDYPLLTVALRSGDDAEVNAYLQSKQLSWQVVNDQQGLIANAYGVSAVPAVFFTDSNGKIVFTTTGYTSELGLRLRLWLAAWL